MYKKSEIQAALEKMLNLAISFVDSVVVVKILNKKFEPLLSLDKNRLYGASFDALTLRTCFLRRFGDFKNSKRFVLNSRKLFALAEYGANYHILNTIALYDIFTPRGKTGLRDYTRSKYCSKSEVANEFEELIKNAEFKYIFLSYNNEGLMSEYRIREIMLKYGKYNLVKKEYQRFRADKSENRNHKADSTFEYLHILEKN